MSARGDMPRAHPECLASSCPPPGLPECQWPKCAPRPSSLTKAEDLALQLASVGDVRDAYRAALELVREGLDIPHAKTVGDDEKRGQIIQLRMIDVLIMVGHILDGDSQPDWTLDYCREQLARRPAAGYHPASAPMAYGMYEACAAEGCGHRQGSHWEFSEPGGPRTGCGYLGCPCTAWDGGTPEGGTR